MAKTSTRYVCQQCGYESVGFYGKCPGCRAWNSMVEELELPAGTAFAEAASEPELLSSIEDGDLCRVSSGMAEMDRVLGGGIVPGSLVLVGGDPGIGKSTLLLQLARGAGPLPGCVLYVSGEESVRQTRMRAERMGVCGDNVYVLAENDLSRIEAQVQRLSPSLLVIDSIQTVFDPELSSAPGSVAQVRDCTCRLMRLAKGLGLPVFIVGHVTKDGSIAGPRVLEHMVDSVLYFEGERYHSYRLLRAVKNRFGSTNELGVFEMTDAGLREVPDAAGIFLSDRARDASGSSVAAVLEGSRSMLVEIQGLVCVSGLGVPRRLATGMDHNRLCMLLAVLEKRVGLHLSQEDVYVNVVGGARLEEPAADLAVAVAVASSHKDRPLDRETIFIGEVGLTGELRAARQTDLRLREAARLGFARVVAPPLKDRNCRDCGLEVHEAASLEEALEVALSG